MVVNLLSAPDVLLTVKIALAQSFSKFCSSYSVADQAHKAGLKLILVSTDEKILTSLLISLTKLASRWAVLIPSQITFILSLFDDAKNVQAVLIRCLGALFSKIQSFPLGENSVRILLKIANEDALPSSMRYGALKIIHKLLLCGESCLTNHDLPEFEHLLQILEKSIFSTSAAESFEAIHIWVDIVTRIKPDTDMIQTKDSALFPTTNLQKAHEIISTFLKLLCYYDHSRSRNKQSVLNLVTQLVKSFLHQNNFVVEALINMIQEKIHFREKEFLSKYFPYAVLKVLNQIIEVLNEDSAITPQIVEKVFFLTDSIQISGSYNRYQKVKYSIFSHSRIMWNQINALDEKKFGLRLVEREFVSVNLVKEMFENNEDWLCYKAGKFAALQGAWNIASLLFEQLTSKVKSNSNLSWMKALSELSESEKKVLLNLVRVDQNLVVNDKVNHIAVLAEASHHLFLSLERLKTSTQNDLFCFQIWFLNLKVKLLGIIVGILQHLDGTFYQDLEYIMDQSRKLNELAYGFDLTARTFFNMDEKSVKTITALALSCSVLAFISAFPLFIWSKNIFKPNADEWNILKSELTQDLIGRLPFNTERLCYNISRLHGPTLHPELNFDDESIQGLFLLCDQSVSLLINLVNESKLEENVDNPFLVMKKGFNILSTSIIKWLNIHIPLPLQFFSIRPCIGAELFAFDVRHQSHLSVLSGSFLSLTLCLQLKNLPSDRSFIPNKLFCLLSTSRKFQDSDNCLWDIEGMVEMNKKLMNFMAEGTCVRTNEALTDEVCEFVCLDIYNKRQGFGTCLLNVSEFPPGSYFITWHSCCVDNLGRFWNLLPFSSAPTFTIVKDDN